MQWKDGDIEGVIITPLKKYTDARGWLAEMFRSDEIEPDLLPAMGYASVTNPGVTRGPHEHGAQSDGFVFLGPGDLKVGMWDRRESSPTHGNRTVLVAGESNPIALFV